MNYSDIQPWEVTFAFLHSNKLLNTMTSQVEQKNGGTNSCYKITMIVPKSFSDGVKINKFTCQFKDTSHESIIPSSYISEVNMTPCTDHPGHDYVGFPVFNEYIDENGSITEGESHTHTGHHSQGDDTFLSDTCRIIIFESCNKVVNIGSSNLHTSSYRIYIKMNWTDVSTGLSSDDLVTVMGCKNFYNA